VQIDSFAIVAELSGGILMLRNQDVPGVIGRIGTFLGRRGSHRRLALGRPKSAGRPFRSSTWTTPSRERSCAARKLPNIMDAQYLISEKEGDTGEKRHRARRQWGDEGKGKIVDIYSSSPIRSCVHRGNNAGHTSCQGEKYIFHLIPSGILHPGKKCVIATGW